MIDYTSLSRGQWLDVARRFYARLQGELATFTPSDWDRVSPYLGWRNRDLLAHMASATSVNFREMLDRALAGDPSAPREFYTFSRNAHEVERRRRDPVAESLREFGSGVESILAVYQGMNDQVWLAPAWFFVGPVNVRTLFLAHLGDNVFHERDLLCVTGRWRGLDPEVVGPLVDWFLREVRPSFFRPEKASGLRATAMFRLAGATSGEWTMKIDGGRCSVERGAVPHPDVTIEADTEHLIAAAQARAAPSIGRIARWADWLGGPSHREDFVAMLTGVWSAFGAILARRLRVSGRLGLAARITACFWYFWERSEQTERNIAAGAVDAKAGPVKSSAPDTTTRRLR